MEVRTQTSTGTYSAPSQLLVAMSGSSPPSRSPSQGSQKPAEMGGQWSPAGPVCLLTWEGLFVERCDLRGR